MKIHLVYILKDPDTRFSTSVFSSNNFPWVPDTQDKAFSNMASHSRRQSTKLVEQRCQWHRCDFGPHIREALATFKGNIYRENIHRQTVLHYAYNIHTKNMGLTRDSFLSQRCHWHHCDENLLLQSRFSSRIWSLMQKGFNPCNRGLGGVDLWKIPEVENLVSGSL
jgi:hypothetical protein